MALIESLSGVTTRALANNKQDQYLVAPTTSATEPIADGIYSEGEDLVKTPTKIILFPFAQGEPLVEFFARVYGWRRLGFTYGEDIWFPYLLAE